MEGREGDLGAAPESRQGIRVLRHGVEPVEEPRPAALVLVAEECDDGPDPQVRARQNAAMQHASTEPRTLQHIRRPKRLPSGAEVGQVRHGRNGEIEAGQVEGQSRGPAAGRPVGKLVGNSGAFESAFQRDNSHRLPQKEARHAVERLQVERRKGALDGVVPGACHPAQVGMRRFVGSTGVRRGPVRSRDVNPFGHEPTRHHSTAARKSLGLTSTRGPVTTGHVFTKVEAVTKVTLIDNYDSFTWNLVHYLGQLGAEVTVHRNDAVKVADVLAETPEAIVLSPGPCTPREAGICLDVIKAAGSTTPILGVCLGHQAIGDSYGGTVGRATIPMHGKRSTVRHRGEAVFHGINGPFEATRYHSLVVSRDGLPETLKVTAETDDGTIMGLSHRTHPVHGVQFHPESIASEHGHLILKNFLDLAQAWNARKAAA